MILPSNTQIIRKVAEMYFKIGKEVKKGPMHTSIYIFKILFFYFLNLFCCVREFLSCRQSTTILKVFPGPKIVCIVVHMRHVYFAVNKNPKFLFIFLEIWLFRNCKRFMLDGRFQEKCFKICQHIPIIFIYCTKVIALFFFIFIGYCSTLAS